MVKAITLSRFQNFDMNYFWKGDLLSHWSSLGLVDLFILIYIVLLATFIFVTNRLFVGKYSFAQRKHCMDYVELGITVGKKTMSDV